MHSPPRNRTEYPPSSPKAGKVTKPSQDEFNTRIEQWCEELSDRMVAVEGGQKTLEERMGQIEGKVDKSATVTNENNLLLHKVLLAVQGQTEKGLERPGLTDDVKRLEATIKTYKEEADKRLDSVETWQNRAIWWGMGVTAAFSVGLFTWGDKFIEVLKALT